MKTIILANGNLVPPLHPMPADAYVIAADGGARHCPALKLRPHVIIGDLDSLSAGEAAKFEQAGVEIIRHPAAKDETDLELALAHAVARGATEIMLLGALGGRWDMTFANLLLLAAPTYAGIRLRLLEGAQEMHILRGGERLTLRGTAGDTVSVIPLRGDAEGITYQGLSWPLENARLIFSAPRGVSNTMTGDSANIALQKGIVLCVHDKISR